MIAAMAMAQKDPTKARAGRLGARARWGEPRIARLDDLTPEQRRLVRALIDAAREQAAPAIVSPGTAMEDDGGDRRLPRSA